MNYKKTACIVLGVCVVLALVIFGLSKIHISKKDTGVEVQVTETPINVDVDNDKEQNKDVSTATPTPTDSSTPTDSATASSEIKGTEKPSERGTWQEINEDSLTYSKDVQSVSGSVTGKKIYSTGGTQLIYDVEITSTLGNSEQLFHYYCTYNTFNELKEKDLVLVEYRQVGDNNFVVCSLSK